MLKWKLKIAILLIISSMMIFVADACNVTFTAAGDTKQRNGVVTSIGFPRPYPAGVNCEYHFINTKGTQLQLTFTDFNLRYSVPGTEGQCAFDFLDTFLIDSSRTPMKLLGRRCGDKLPQQLVTNAHRVIIYFKSRSNINGRFTGFRAEYKFSNETVPLAPPPPSDSDESLCGSPKLRGTGGVLSAPTLRKLPSLREEQRRAILSTGVINCTWNIRISEGDQILVNFLSINLGPSEVVCKDSFLLMYNSASDFEHSGSLEKICGQLSLFPGRSKAYVSSGTWLTIRYIYKLPTVSRVGTSAKKDSTASSDALLPPTVSSALTNQPSFRLVWTAIWRIDESEECPGFECSGRQTCLDAGKVVCHNTPRYCVHPTLRCDGIPHCGPNDTSDEEHCQLPLILSGVAAGIGIILTLFAVIAIIVWRIRMPKQRKTKAKPIKTSRSVKSKPSGMSRMLEHMPYKTSETVEYDAILNDTIVNSRSIANSMPVQENGQKPTTIKPAVVVNRSAGLISVRFAPGTPPESPTKSCNPQTEPLIQKLSLTNNSDVRSEKTRRASRSSASSGPESVAKRMSMTSTRSTGEAKIVSSKKASVASVIFTQDSGNEDSRTTKIIDVCRDVEEVTSSVIVTNTAAKESPVNSTGHSSLSDYSFGSFPPPPSTEEIRMLSEIAPPPSDFLDSPEVQSRKSSTANTSRSRKAKSHAQPHHKKQPAAEYNSSSAVADSSSPLLSDTNRKSSTDAKTIAKLLREPSPKRPTAKPTHVGPQLALSSSTDFEWEVRATLEDTRAPFKEEKQVSPIRAAACLSYQSGTLPTPTHSIHTPDSLIATTPNRHHRRRHHHHKRSPAHRPQRSTESPTSPVETLLKGDQTSKQETPPSFQTTV